MTLNRALVYLLLSAFLLQGLAIGGSGQMQGQTSTYSKHDFSFEYPTNTEIYENGLLGDLPDVNSGVITGLYTSEDSHSIIISWIVSDPPADNNAQDDLLTGGIKTGLGLLNPLLENADSLVEKDSGEASVEGHKLLYREYEIVSAGGALYGVIGSWYCNETRRLFTLNVIYGKESAVLLLEQYLNTFVCHSKKELFEYVYWGGDEIYVRKYSSQTEIYEGDRINVSIILRNTGTLEISDINIANHDQDLNGFYAQSPTTMELSVLEPGQAKEFECHLVASQGPKSPVNLALKPATVEYTYAGERMFVYSNPVAIILNPPKPPEPRVVITKRLSNASVGQYENLKVTITAENKGQKYALDVNISDHVPQGFVVTGNASVFYPQIKPGGFVYYEYMINASMAGDFISNAKVSYKDSSDSTYDGASNYVSFTVKPAKTQKPESAILGVETQNLEKSVSGKEPLVVVGIIIVFFVLMLAFYLVKR